MTEDENGDDNNSRVRENGTGIGFAFAAATRSRRFLGSPLWNILAILSSLTHRHRASFMNAAARRTVIRTVRPRRFNCACTRGHARVSVTDTPFLSWQRTDLLSLYTLTRGFLGKFSRTIFLIYFLCYRTTNGIWTDTCWKTCTVPYIGIKTFAGVVQDVTANLDYRTND